MAKSKGQLKSNGFEVAERADIFVAKSAVQHTLRAC